MLPDPALTLTLPSIHDGNVLDCRVYHPSSLQATNFRAPAWRRHAAIVAHPYAPLGGCFDDPIVDAVGAELLRRGFLVTTFNFRGAGHSAGRTSWTSRPERDDYMSVVGFLVYYLHYLDPFSNHEREHEEALSPLRSENRIPDLDGTKMLPSATGMQNSRSPVLLFAGYSYGAMITSQLPPIKEILEHFASPDAGSEAAQIRLRAENLAMKQNLILGDARTTILEMQPKSPGKRGGVRVGGDESCSSSPRASHDGFRRRSFSHDTEERLRKGVNELLAKTKSRHCRHASRPVNTVPNLPVAAENGPADGKLPGVEGLIESRPAYLLISPLQGIINHLATMSLMPTVLARTRERDIAEDASERKLFQNPTVAVFGDKDIFVPIGKLRAWVDRLRSKPESMFQAHEIGTAGHFWVEAGVLHRMRDLIGGFADNLLKDGE